jgi:hypothetical protein
MIKISTTGLGPVQKCEFCGDKKELRPYGPNSEWICFPCAMKDEKTTIKKFIESMEKQEILTEKSCLIKKIIPDIIH